MKNHSEIYPLLNKWDIKKGGPKPSPDELDAAHRCVPRMGTKQALSLALNFRVMGSTPDQRDYAGGGGRRDNVGALGESIREQYGSTRQKRGWTKIVTAPSGQHVNAISLGNGSWKFELAEAASKTKSSQSDFPTQYALAFEDRLKKITDTERDAIVRQRTCQGVLRELLLERRKSCQVTGLQNSKLLRASHVVPWAESNRADQKDPDNVLLLAVHIDAAFDQFLISFDATGKILISDTLDQEARELLGLHKSMRLRDYARHERFMARHRARLSKSR